MSKITADKVSDRIFSIIFSDGEAPRQSIGFAAWSDRANAFTFEPHCVGVLDFNSAALIQIAKFMEDQTKLRKMARCFSGYPQPSAVPA